MKKFFMIALLSFCFISCSSNDVNEINNNTDLMMESKSSLAYTDAILRGWSDKKNCLRGYGDCAIAIIKDGYPSEGLFAVKLELVSPNQILMTYTGNEVSEDEGVYLNFSNDTAIVNEVANNLGYSSILVKAGMYKIDRSENPKGQVILTIEAD